MKIIMLLIFATSYTFAAGHTRLCAERYLQNERISLSHLKTVQKRYFNNFIPPVNPAWKEYGLKVREHLVKPSTALPLLFSAISAGYLYNEKQVEKLTNTIEKINEKTNEITIEVFSRAESYQTRGSFLSKAPKKKDGLNLELILKKKIEKLQEIKEKLDSKSFILFNVFFRDRNRDFREKLKNTKQDLLINSHLNKALDLMDTESFGSSSSCLKNALTELHAKKKGFANGNRKSQEELLKKNLSLVTNVKSMSDFRFALLNKSNKERYINDVNSIIGEISDSIKENDQENPYSYAQIAYLKLNLIDQIANSEDKEKLNNEIDKAMKNAQTWGKYNPVILNLLGLCHMKRDNLVSARSCYDRAIKIDENNPAYFCNRAAVLLRTEGRLKDCHDDIKKANSLKPGDCDIIGLHFEASLYMKKCEEAHVFYESICTDCGGDKNQNMKKLLDKLCPKIKSSFFFSIF